MEVVRPRIARRWLAPAIVPLLMGMVLSVAPRAAGAASGSSDAAGTRTPVRPEYTVNLTSDRNGSRWRGTESVTFTNSSTVTLQSVWIRLWDNGIEGCQSSLPIQVSNVVGGTAGSLDVDCTALPVTLDSPIGEGDTATLSFDLTILVPDSNNRFGRIGKMALLGNALPVLAIHDGLGWHLDPYVAFGEAFYSQVGDFTVTLDVPAGLVTPATGVATTVRRHAARAATTFVATDVRDFAWASGPLQELDGTATTGVTVRVWWPSEISLSQAQRALSIGEDAIAFHASKYGPYFYDEVDIVLGTFTAFGGMEYPQFVMSDPNDSVIVHELGHQWWYGIVGDDEYNEPWLDEAFASYATDVFYDDQGIGCASIRFPNAQARVTNTMKYFTEHAGEYGLVVYSIGACALHDLSKTLGPRVMTQFLRSYAKGHAAGWSTTAEFRTAAQKVASELHDPIDLTPLWHKWRIGPP